MSGKQAKTLSTDHIDDLLFFADHSRHPLRNRLIVLLSVKAGLRAAEIAKLSWDMVVDPAGQIGTVLELHDRVAKKVDQSRYIATYEKCSLPCGNWTRVMELWSAQSAVAL